MDKHLSVCEVTRSKAILVVLTSVFIASKFEEIYHVNSNTFVKHLRSPLVTKESILNMEQKILESLNFKLMYICPRDILKRLVYILQLSPAVGSYCFFMCQS